MALILEIGFGIWVFLVAVILAFMRGASLVTSPPGLADEGEAQGERVPAVVNVLRQRRG